MKSISSFSTVSIRVSTPVVPSCTMGNINSVNIGPKAINDDLGESNDDRTWPCEKLNTAWQSMMDLQNNAPSPFAFNTPKVQNKKSRLFQSRGHRIDCTQTESKVYSCPVRQCYLRKSILRTDRTIHQHSCYLFSNPPILSRRQLTWLMTVVFTVVIRNNQTLAFPSRCHHSCCVYVRTGDFSK